MADEIAKAASAAISNTVKLAVVEDMAESSKKIQQDTQGTTSPSPTIEGAGEKVDIKV